MDVANRITLELPFRGLVAFNIRQTADTVTLEAAMQGRPGEMGDRGL